MKFSGIILAGGESTRFDYNKIKIKIGKVPLFIDQIFKLNFFCDEIIVVSNLKNYKIILNEFNNIKKYYKFYFQEKNKIIAPIKIVLDDDSLTNNNFQSVGPIAGIFTGLKEANNQYSIIQAFDMPFTSYNLFSLLISKNDPEHIDAVMIKTQKGVEVLCAIYSKKCIEVILQNIKNKKYKITEILPYLNVHFISEKELESYKVDQLNFFNVNSEIDNYNFKSIWNNGHSESFASSPDIVTYKKWENFFYRGIGNRIN